MTTNVPTRTISINVFTTFAYAIISVLLLPAKASGSTSSQRLEARRDVGRVVFETMEAVRRFVFSPKRPRLVSPHLLRIPREDPRGDLHRGRPGAPGYGSPAARPRLASGLPGRATGPHRLRHRAPGQDTRWSRRNSGRMRRPCPGVSGAVAMPRTGFAHSTQRSSRSPMSSRMSPFGIDAMSWIISSG